MFFSYEDPQNLETLKKLEKKILRTKYSYYLLILPIYFFIFPFIHSFTYELSFPLIRDHTRLYCCNEKQGTRGAERATRKEEKSEKKTY